MPSVSILVDVQNVYYTTKQGFSAKFDYGKFWQQVSQHRKVEHAVAYAIESKDEMQQRFQNRLKQIGFEVKLKPFIQRADGSAKGDWDVGITLDAMEFAEQSDTVVIVSGDGDFDMLVQRMQSKHQCAVEVYGVEKLTADSLIRSADKFIPITSELLIS